MRLCRFNGNRFGVVSGDRVADVTHVLDRIPCASYPYPRNDAMIAALAEIRPDIESAAVTAEKCPIEAVKLASPVANPGKLIAAPVNYKRHLEEVRDQAELHHNNQKHAREIQESGLFLKATSSLIGPGELVRLRFPDRRNDHEIELAVIIGTEATEIAADNALGVVAGYAIGLDMTLRGPEERSMRKSIDTYSVLGPWLVTADEIGNPGNLAFELSVNGEVRQSANTCDLVLDIPELIAFASRYYTLYPGDIIFTGTPEGVGPIKHGDVIRARFDSIGEMTVNVEGTI